ncbi:hypothetical protein [Acinetobacter sp. ANC 5054]|uniref:hypothetical protein n=1 Tax=Acinetobacter sp. ANC 5054 TaxID=1977877 RepID=UPI001178C474|nr:hypothetical protein [Acinetobacter sp. ANC 5054]
MCMDRPEAILKKICVFTPLILATCFSQIALAKDEVTTVNKSCVKDYPLALGDTDLEIISYYNQLCDKKNKKNSALKNEILVDIAKKYQVNGYNLKALQVVNSLRLNNYYSPDLTDVTFLAGVAISHNALNQMRNNENRTLDESTYSPAKVLADNIRYIQPSLDKKAYISSDLDEKSVETVASTVKFKKSSQPKTKKQTNTQAKKTTQAKQNTTVKSHVKQTVPTPVRKPAAGSSPFDTLKK